jgi:hypothetical protein
MMKDAPEVLGDLLKVRVASIEQARNKDFLKNLILAEPAIFRRYSVVFNAFYQSDPQPEPKICAQEIFVELSRLPNGFPDLADTMARLSGIAGFPDFRFNIFESEKKTIVGLAYEKKHCAMSYNTMRLKSPGQVIYFLFDLRIMIETAHAKRILLPPGWIDQDVLFSTADGMPVIIGYNGIRKFQTHKDFFLGCVQDWRTFLFLLGSSEKKAYASQLLLYAQLRREISTKISVRAPV